MAIPVSIETSAPLRNGAALSSDLSADLKKLVAGLGLEGDPGVELHEAAPGRALRIRVRGVLQPYPPGLMRRVWTAAGLPGSVPSESGGAFPDGWLADRLERNQEGLPEFICLLAMEVIRSSPSCLLGPEQEAAFGERLGAALRALLDLGISLAEQRAVRTAFGEGAALARSPMDTAEALFDRLRPARIEIQLPQAAFEALTGRAGPGEPVSVYEAGVPAGLRQRFAAAEDNLYQEMGVRLPALVLAASRGLRAGVGAVRVNDVPGTPFTVGAGEDELPGAVFTELTRQLPRLLSLADVEYQLAQLHQAAPRVVECALRAVPLEELKRTLRALLVEGVSIRDLRGILERLLEFDSIRAGGLREAIVLDDRLVCSPATPPGAANWQLYREFVRQGMKDHLYLRYGGGSVSRIDPEVEARLETIPTNYQRGELRGVLTEAEAERIRDGVWTLVNGDRRPAILTTAAARAAIREIVAAELPDVAVLAYSEVPDAVWLATRARNSATVPVSH